jgi:hypothetical protein
VGESQPFRDARHPDGRREAGGKPRDLHPAANRWIVSRK